MVATETKEELREVGIGSIEASPYQPRSRFAEEELRELSESIRSVGLIHPPVVRESDRPGIYELIAGERRFRASKMAGLTRIPVMVVRRSDRRTAQASLIENLQRVDLSPVEIAQALRNLIDQFGFTQDELATRIGKRRSTLSNYLRTLTLPKEIQESLTSRDLTMAHAKVILTVEDLELRMALHERIIDEQLTVREAEQLLQQWVEKAEIERKKQRPKTNDDIHLKSVSESLQEQLGTKVTIRGTGKKGSIQLDYHSLEDLNRLFDLIKQR